MHKINTKFTSNEYLNFEINYTIQSFEIIERRQKRFPEFPKVLYMIDMKRILERHKIQLKRIDMITTDKRYEQYC